MGRINLGRVIVGGLLTGIVVTLGEAILNGVLLYQDVEDALAIMNRPVPDTRLIVLFLLLGFMMSIVSVWLYAAIRPRFGPGMKTAAIAGIAVWLLAYVYPSALTTAMKLLPRRLTFISVLWGLPEIILGTIAGAWVYKEP